VSRPLLLGVDVGTTSAKAAIYALDGELVAEASEPCQVERPRDGWLEQEPAEIWRGASAAIRAAAARVPAGSHVGAIGVCGHSPTLVLLGADDRPVRTAILWQDRRAAAEATELAERIPAEMMIDLLGARLPPGPSYPPPRLLWLRRHEPEVLARTAAVLDTKDWINFNLTGRRRSDPWSAKGLANMRTGVPIEAWRELLGVDPSIAPETLPAAARCGEVTTKAAAQLGVEPGIPVALGWTDGACGMLGTGCFARPGTAYAIAGTSEVIGTTVARATDDPRIQAAPGPVTEWTLLMGPTQTSGAAVQWAARLLGVEPVELSRLAAEAAPGASGLLFLPYLEGERAPLWDPAARGMFFGLALRHGRPELARAVLEGVAHAVRHVLETMEEIGAPPHDQIRVCGGGAREPLWNQIKADLTGRTVVTLASPDTSSIGAAMLGGVAAGLFPSLDAAARALVRLGDTYAPRPEARAAYDAAHTTYRALYPRLKDLFPA
jgi:xylulokinase